LPNETKALIASSARAPSVADESENVDEEPISFSYGATLRIFGQIPDLDGISRTLGLSPTHTHKLGDQRSLYSPDFFEHDMWSYDSQVPKDHPLEIHIQTLWAHIKPHRAYLMRLKERLTVDVFCEYSTNACGAGIEVSHRSLEMFIELEIPFGLSII
jgi:hypothetical protein